MELLLYIAVASGAALYAGKLYIMSVALRPAPRFKAWIHRTPLALVAMDVLFGFMGMHVVMLGGGSVMSMITMISFGVCSALYILYCSTVTSWKAKRSQPCFSK